MSNALGIIFGGVLVLGGFVLLVAWWSLFIEFLMGTIPIVLMIIGAAVLIYFISEAKSKSEIPKE